MARLSICIPTYNRFRFLQWTLARLRSDFVDAELVVSDNASTDDTGWCMKTANMGQDIYLRQDTNIGPFPNMFAALSAATGHYAVYCADDDYLKPAEIARGIAYLDAHPEVAAYCAPCEI